MFMVQFVHSKDNDFSRTDSFGFPLNPNETRTMYYYQEVLRFMRRMVLMQYKEDTKLVSVSTMYFMQDYRKALCCSLQRSAASRSCDIPKLSEVPFDCYPEIMPFVWEKMGDKSVSDDEFVDWFLKEMMKERPFRRLQAVG